MADNLLTLLSKNIEIAKRLNKAYNNAITIMQSYKNAICKLCDKKSPLLNHTNNFEQHNV